MLIGESQGLDALMSALSSWNGGVILISHDERFITTVAREVSSAGAPLSKYLADVLSSCGYAAMVLS